MKLRFLNNLVFLHIHIFKVPLEFFFIIDHSCWYFLKNPSSVSVSVLLRSSGAIFRIRHCNIDNRSTEVLVHRVPVWNIKTEWIPDGGGQLLICVQVFQNCTHKVKRIKRIHQHRERKKGTDLCKVCCLNVCTSLLQERPLLFFFSAAAQHAYTFQTSVIVFFFFFHRKMTNDFFSVPQKCFWVTSTQFLLFLVSFSGSRWLSMQLLLMDLCSPQALRYRSVLH